MFALAGIEDTAMGEYLFALPVEAVAKAIVYPAHKIILQDGIGMMNLGSRSVTIVDLRQKLTTIDPQTDPSKFLILFNTQGGELCGLPVKDAPILLDLPLGKIRPLPAAYRQVNQLSFASHLAIVPQGEDRQPLQILLLGMERILGQSIADRHHLN